jgi:hypothetical protein
MRFNSTVLPAVLAGLLFTSLALAIDSLAPGEVGTPGCAKGTVLLSEDFAGNALDKSWTTPKGKWEVADAVLKGVEKPEDHHAAVIRHALKAHDLITQFSFRFDGGKMLALSLNNSKGHVCRAQITPTAVSLQKDKPGKDSPEKPASLGKETVELKPGEWHTILVTVCGKQMTASLDGKQIITGSNDGIDVEKTSIGFPTTGDGVSIKEVRVWEAVASGATAKSTEK